MKILQDDSCRVVDLRLSGQIITTSADVTLNGGLIRELPQNPLNSGLGIILICPGLFVDFSIVTFCWPNLPGFIQCPTGARNLFQRFACFFFFPNASLKKNIFVYPP